MSGGGAWDMELPMGHETSEGCADMGGWDACGLRHWDLRWSSRRGHETYEACADMGGWDACGLRQ